MLLFETEYIYLFPFHQFLLQNEQIPAHSTAQPQLTTPPIYFHGKSSPLFISNQDSIITLLTQLSLQVPANEIQKQANHSVFYCSSCWKHQMVWSGWDHEGINQIQFTNLLIWHLLLWMEPREDTHQEPRSHKIDYSLMTEAEREAEFRKQHQQYIAEKIARKKEMLRLRRAEIGSSSSDDSDDDGRQSSSSGSDVGRRRKEGDREVPQLKSGHHSHKKNEEQPVQSLKFSIHSLKKGGEWVKDLLQFQGDTLTVLNIPYDIKTFNKVKIFAENIQGSPFKIKISIEQLQLLFSPIASKTDQWSHLPTNYFIFAKIVQERLLQTGIRLREANQQKIAGIPEAWINNCQIYGKMIKKSQVLGKWQQRFVVINREGLFSYKKFNEKHTMHLARGSIKEIWTRFNIQDEMLVVKVMQNSKKIEFGVPLVQVLCRSCWLFCLFQLMNKK